MKKVILNQTFRGLFLSHTFIKSSHLFAILGSIKRGEQHVSKQSLKRTRVDHPNHHSIDSRSKRHICHHYVSKKRNKRYR